MTRDVLLRRSTWLSFALAGGVLAACLPSAAARDRDEWRARRLERHAAMGVHDGHRAERGRRHDGHPSMREMPAREMPVRETPMREMQREAPMPAPPPVLPPPPPPPVDAGGRPGRLTPDERRALRQQINDAGRDVYRPNRP